MAMRPIFWALLMVVFAVGVVRAEDTGAGGAATETAPATQTTTKRAAPPAAPLIGSRTDAVNAGALDGIWINDAGPDRLVLSLSNKTGQFRFDGVKGPFFTNGSQITLFGKAGPTTYDY